MSPTPPPFDYDQFLRSHVHSQPRSIMRYEMEGTWFWLKRTGPQIPLWRYRLLGAVSRMLHEPVLAPVINPGGRTAIATEIRRIQDLAARGIRVPELLASGEDGFIMRHLGITGQDLPSLANTLRDAAPQGAAAVLPAWQQGLDMLDQVHRAGTALSQAFARNMVICPDGQLACIDFEDDPTAVLPMVVCQVRDVLCYAHSTALYMAHAGAMVPARTRWKEWVSRPERSAEFHQVLANTLRHMRWLKILPASNRLGRDTARLRVMWDLMT